MVARLVLFLLLVTCSLSAQVTGGRYGTLSTTYVAPSEEEPGCACNDLAPVSGNLPRFYRRLTDAAGSQWQSYSWQLVYIRQFVAAQGGTVLNEDSGYYRNSDFMNPVTPGTRYTNDGNPQNPFTSNFHYVDYSTAAYYNSTTDLNIYYRHGVDFEIDAGCGLEKYRWEATYNYQPNDATTGWQYVEADYQCTKL